MVEELCETCQNFKSCTVYNKYEDTIIFCENYEPDGKISGQSKNSIIQELKGLCINCGKRYTCRFLKPDGGVWHCEEYE